MGSRGLIARNLRRARLLRQLSQEALAFEADVDPSYISGIERLDRNPSVDVLDKLAKALGIRTGALFDPGTEPLPPNLPRGRRRTRRR